MDLQQTHDALNKFAKEVIKQSRANLTRGNKNYKRTLYDSLDFELDVFKNSFGLSFMMEEYGHFQDKGVRGKDPSKVSKNARIRGQQAPNSPYRFGSGNFAGKWSEFTMKMEAWAKFRRIRLRDEKGRFKQGDYKTIAQIIASNIYARGIKPSLFFTKPFEANFERLPDALVERFQLDLDKFFDFTLK